MEAGRQLRVFGPGSASWGNKGDAALLFAMVDSLRNEFGEVEFVFSSLTPDPDAEQYGFPFVPMPLAPDSIVSGLSYQFARRVGRPGLAPYAAAIHLGLFLTLMRVWLITYRAFGAPAYRLLSRRIANVVRAITRADITIAVPGGYLMAPVPGDRVWLYHAAPLLLAKMLGKPLVLYPCSLGPFPGFPNRFWARQLLRRCDAVLVREDYSFQQARRLGVPADRLALVPDTAFLFDDDGRSDVELAPVRQRLAHLPRPWIGVSVRSHAFAGVESPERAWQDYLDDVAAAASSLQERLGGSVIFVPQNTGEGWSNDVAVARDVETLMTNADRVLVIRDDLSPQALKTLYGQLDLLIATRLHAAILGMTAGTPVAAIAYQPKTLGVFRMLGLERFALPIEETRTRLADAAWALWSERETIRAALAERIPGIKEECRASARRVRVVLATHGECRQGAEGVATAND